MGQQTFSAKGQDILGFVGLGSLLQLLNSASAA